MAEPQSGLETPKDAGPGAKGLVKYWKLELELAEKHERQWRQRGVKVVERYRDEKRRGGKRLNILWANTETLKPAVFSQLPEPDVRRRYLDMDPVGRQASEVIERALSFSTDDYPMMEVIESVRDDMLLPGRGVCRVQLEADIVEVPQFFGDVVEEIGDQRVFFEPVYWEDFRIFPAGVRCWGDVYGVAFKHLFTRDELVENFGAKGKDVPLNHLQKDFDDAHGNDRPEAEPLKRAEVWEIWDGRNRERLWVAEGFDEFVDREDDPLGLEDFYPVPKPLYALQTTDTMVPIPEFTLYQDQADELDKITSRIEKLISALKVRGIYAAGLEKMADILKGEDLTLEPIGDWEKFVEKGGLERAIHYLPLEPIAQVLAGLYQQRDILRKEIFEITGISDVIRGSTDPRETLGAQKLKGNFGQFRMIPRRAPMERFIRDMYRMKAEVIAEHYTLENLAKMTGLDIRPEVIALLKDEKIRGFKVDVETESTVQPNADQERANATEFAQSVAGYLKAATDIGQASPAMVPLLLETFKFTVRRFKVGRELEDVIEQTTQQLTQQAQQPSQPDPDAEAKKQEMLLKARQQASAEERSDAELELQEQEQRRKAVETAAKIANEEAASIPDPVGAIQ